MSSDVLKTLFLPFHDGLLEWPFPEDSSGFYYAENCPELENFSDLGIWQPMKDRADTLPYEDIQPGFNIGLCLLPKQKEEAQFILARAAHDMKTNGLLVVAATNNAGGKRIEGMMEALGFATQSLSKHKARVVWGYKEAVQDDVIAQWLKEGDIQDIEIDGETYTSQPGLFSWNEKDPGSVLLLDHLPALSGIGADFGCGFGFLSREVLEKSPAIEKLYAIDVDKRAVEVCKKNADAEGVWHDLRLSPDIPPLDFIVMNPPFHSGKKTDIDLGQSFIQTASSSLRPDGSLYMVANRQLPYESILDALFQKWSVLSEEKGYKVFHAITKY